jgi:hypothetical protein
MNGQHKPAVPQGRGVSKRPKIVSHIGTMPANAVALPELAPLVPAYTAGHV